MNQRDDMVMRLGVKSPSQTPARDRAKQERIIRGAQRRGGLVHRLARAKASRTLIRAAQPASTARMAVARGGARAAGAVAGVVVGTLVVAAVVATRLLSGRSFENIGQQINNVLLGDLDEEALATRDSREALQGDEHLLRIAGKEGKVNSQIAQIHQDQVAINKRDRVGRTLFESATDFQSNNILDMVILRVKDALVEHWNAVGGQSKFDELTKKLGRPKANTR